MRAWKRCVAEWLMAEGRTAAAAIWMELDADGEVDGTTS